MLKNIILNSIIILTAIQFLPQQIFAQKDTVKNYWLKPVEISAKKINIGDYSKEASKDKLKNIFENNGFSLIRKGVFFAQDIYADGFKRGDINIVVDGERYHNACPNRMDSPLIRVNPIELKSVEMSKSSGSIQAGLGGIVEFKRTLPQKDLNMKVALSGTAGAQNSIDFSSSVDYEKQQFNIRYSEGTPYKDGNGNTFKDNYGYEDNFKYKLAEAALRGVFNNFRYGASILYTDNVLFPYLKMDEKITRVYSAFLRYGQHKVYMNYTRHIMDNDLRISKMLMRTDAKNLTVGAIGNFYEVVYNNWDADNFLRSSKFNILNSLMPNVSTFTLNVFKSLDYMNFSLHGKLGVVYHSVCNKEREKFYKMVYNNVNLSNFFPTFSFGISRITSLGKNLGWGIMLEANSESPEPETLYISVKKPMGKPAWSGNPNLKQPLKSTLRTSLYYDKISLELYGTKVWNYINLISKVTEGKKYLTYDNINAIMIGFDFNAKYRNVEINASYIWAKNNTNDMPLAEIPPFRITTKLISPKFSNIFAYVKHTFNNSQDRIYELLNEKATPAWNRLDLGIVYSINNINISLEAENITNAQYYQHLSYLRDPFASGINVFEPGRTIRLSFMTNKIF